MITRKEYRADQSPDAHFKYYSQFATPSVQELVARTIGIDRIKKSTDPHLNDIPLREWDNLAPSVKMLSGRLMAKANNGGISLSDCVCTAKAAARILLER